VIARPAALRLNGATRGRRWSSIATVALAVFGFTLPRPAAARTVVFLEPGFPALESEAPSREVLAGALQDLDPQFIGLEELTPPGALGAADLLVLPYGSAFPADAWVTIRAYLEGGGNLLTVGGRPLWIPVFKEGGRFRPGAPQNTYWRLLAAVDATEIPRHDFTRFAWDPAFAFESRELRARRVFAVDTLFVANFGAPVGSWRGLGFFLDDRGYRIAAPVSRLDFSLIAPEPRPPGRGRLVMLNFEPEPGYWDSPAGRTLIRETAQHAALGSAQVWVELPRASVLEEETAAAVLHVRDWNRTAGEPRPVRRARVELRRDGQVLETREVPLATDPLAANLMFAATSAPGLYEVRATLLQQDQIVEVHETGFWRRDEALLHDGPKLSAGTTYLRRDGKPFLAVGVNHWVNDSVWPFFPENGNALEWERDFAEMEARGFNFVRTGIWFDRLKLVDSATGAAKEAVLRNIEAMLQSAGRHHLHVQFTIFAFEPQTILRSTPEGVLGPGRNPYTDPVAIDAQQTFVRSIAGRFKEVPFLSWDLINEPSFSNPRVIFRGNQPNADATEIAAWNDWLRKRYESGRALASAWRTIPDDVPELAGLPLPAPAELTLTRNGNPRQLRALDYNLFAQDMFGRWAGEMVRAIRGTGSQQLVAVGQDEGGVTNRLLNQFYGGAGIDLTSLHNWWHDDALLWASVAAKRPGLPNLLGETGPQPVIPMEGGSRWDEVKGLGLVERKMALGLAAANAGSVVWIWSRSDPFHFGHADGSSSSWVDALERLARFAHEAEPYLSDARPLDVAMVLPQSLQLSVLGEYAIEAQQKCIRALYHRARSVGYAVGEYQLDLLGNPRLIVLPSPWVFSRQAWETLLDKVRGGSTLLVTGRFDLDEHFQPTDRHRSLGLEYGPGILHTRENPVGWPGGGGLATFSGNKTTYLDQALLEGGGSFARRVVGKGQVLFVALPIELNDDLGLIGSIYRSALAEARVAPLYSTSLEDPGILICPTPLQDATLYVLTSESSVRRDVRFRDLRSGKDLSTVLEPGRAALLLVTGAGRIVARYEGSP
jgi:Cellulase (glycosyl hydrolase family 5)